jgi:hypothetical protein
MNTRVWEYWNAYEDYVGDLLEINRRLNNTVAKLRWRLTHCGCYSEDEFEWVMCDRDLISDGKEAPALEHHIVELIEAWHVERAEGNWHDYLQREREIREKARETA